MNKQELIEKIAESVKNEILSGNYYRQVDNYGYTEYDPYDKDDAQGVANDIILDLEEELDEPQITDEQAWNKIAESYPESAQSLRNTLDNVVFGKAGEPQKPVVLQFVADWFEENKDNLEFAIWELCVDPYNAEAEPKIIDWIQCTENKPIETLIRMKDGYKVEKESLYYVDFINNDEEHKRLILDNDNGKYSIVDWSDNLIGLVQEIFTEEEIKSFDERYWAFAVPVEEVAE